jgi:hypothetical protein
MNRRSFLESTAASALLASTPLSAIAATTPSVIIVGGGMAGATVAKYIRLWSRNTISVLLIDTNSTYVSNIMSNLVVTGQVARSSLNFAYSTLKSKYGVQFLQATVSSITRSNNLWSVVAGGKAYTANRVVLAPGISFDSVPLLANNRDATDLPAASAAILHAWQAGPQTDALAAQLSRFPTGGTYVLSIPASPYRCPPGPYERACVIADYLQRNKPGSKMLVLDANPKIQAEPVSFGFAFNTLYAGMLTYVPNAVVSGVWYSGANPTAATGSSAGTVRYDVTTIVNNAPVVTRNFSDAALINVIPKHRAATVVQNVTPAVSGSSARLANAGAQPFAQVDVRSFAARDGVNFPNIHIIGDSHQTGGASGGSGLPMAGHVANQAAKICASAIVAALTGGPGLNTKYLTANSACYSPINNSSASWLTVIYHYNAASETDPAQRQFYPSVNGQILDSQGNRFAATEASAITTGNFSKMGTWYRVLMGDSYG